MLNHIFLVFPISGKKILNQSKILKILKQDQTLAILQANLRYWKYSCTIYFSYGYFMLTFRQN